MNDCPYCGFENIPGADECEQCGHSLTPLSKPQPGSTLERRLMKTPIRELSPRSPFTVSPDTPVGEVLKRMVEKSVGCVVIEQDGSAVGIFTERDAVMRLGSDVDSLRSKPVAEFMTASPATLEVDDRIAFAVQKMDAGGYRHIPVLNEGHILGVISVRDILDFITRDAAAN